MRKLEIYLADLYYINRHTESRLCVPLNIGYIASYANRMFPGDINVTLFKEPELLIDSLNHKKPDIVGLSFYNWNTHIDKYVSGFIKKKYGNNVLVVFGGPSIDSDMDEQKMLSSRFPYVDFFIEGEGELGFSKIIEAVLGNHGNVFNSHIDGAFYFKEGQIVKGAKTAFKLDLLELPSPYLTGSLDEFLTKNQMPLLQATRMCPYTCKFCVSGKDKGKLRSFPLAVIKEEIDYIAKWNRDKPHIILNLAELNFGVNKQDPEIAGYLKEVSDRDGYPKSVYFYSDKRFTERARNVIRALGNINKDGLVFSLQSDNPDALAAVKRKNLSDEDISDGIRFAVEQNVPVSTEMIFGLPYDTKSSMIKLLNKSVSQGFDSILLHNLFLADGTELNRKKYRDAYAFKTKHRLLGSNYTKINGDFVAEYEEILVGNKYFNYDDYLSIRGLNLLFFAVFQGKFYKFFFQYIKNIGIPLADFFDFFMNPSDHNSLPTAYVSFVNRFKKAAHEELYSNPELLYSAAQKIYDQYNDVGEPVRLNLYYYSMLMYSENDWVNDAMINCLVAFKQDLTESEYNLAVQLLDICSHMIVDLNPDPGSDHTSYTEYDLIAWQKDKFLRSIYDYYIGPCKIVYLLSADQKTKVKSFYDQNSHLERIDYGFVAAETIFPRSDLFYNLNLHNSIPDGNRSKIETSRPYA